MKKGSCFNGDPSNRGNNHYWVIANIPNTKVFLVNFTSPKDKKNTHMAKPSDFPCLQYNSIINWDETLHINLPIMQTWINEKRMIRCSPTTEHAVDKILLEARDRHILPAPMHILLPTQ
jgi:hypothetical protein